MKTIRRLLLSLTASALFLGIATPAHAVCGGYAGTNSSGWTTNTSAGTAASSCGVDASSTEAYDYSAGADDATNGYTLTVNTGVTITLNSSSTLVVGKIVVTSGGIVNVSGSGVSLNTGQKCFALDADGDLYSPTPDTCVTASQANYVRKNKLRGNRIDCGDGSATAHPCDNDNATNCSTTPQSTTFTNGVNGALTHDWNCDGTETKTYGESYTCASCNNGTYTSQQNTTSGYAAAVACAASGTYYTVTSAACQAGSGVVTCAAGAVNTQAAQTQTCL